MSLNRVLKKYREFSFSERNKGDRFERLMQAFLQTVPWYAGKFKHVWLWSEFPYKGDTLKGQDTGIDLVAQTREGEYWAIQCKCYDENAHLDKKAIDSFLATSSKNFVGEGHTTTAFSQRMWISTTNNWGANAENAIYGQNPPVARLSLIDLQNAPVDWEELDKGISGEKARVAKKSPLPHQVDAINNFHEHFLNAERGKLIMACGTGKTFTSLKIAEKETNGKGVVLFLAPSIALVGQTLREWLTESDYPIFPICICSDPEVSQKKTKNDDDELDGYRVEDLAWPASTRVPDITKQFRYAEKHHPEKLIVVFSTYQSIEVISKAQKEIQKDFDLIVCDEAHRTTGVTLKGKDDSAFVKVHDNNFLTSRRRVYMTATPRLYAEGSKKKAKEVDAYLCSMDDEAMYGPEVFRIGFGEAVDKQLLSDYKVLVLTLPEKDIPDSLQIHIADKNKEISADDASKLIGCINALSKKMLTDEGLLKASDPSPMRKAVAFCQSIKISKHISAMFNDYKDSFYESLDEEEQKETVNIDADHVDGTMGAATRDTKLAWLNGTPSEGNDCRILCNVRCLSEGVDVPSLDAVLFLSARNSQIDVVQSVGRVMRKAPGKKFGYIIIPVLVASTGTPEKILDDRDSRFKVVWTVLTALRAHDDRFAAMVNKIALNKKKPTGGGSVLIGPSIRKKRKGGNGDGTGGEGGDEGETKVVQGTLLTEQSQKLRDYLYARMVQNVGTKRYWEQWAKDVAEIAERYMERIKRLISNAGPHKVAFEAFLEGLQKNINPSVTSDEVVEMLAQHMITKPVFEALFENYSFVKENPVSQSLQTMIDLLEAQAFEKDTITLSRFYENVRQSISNIDNAESRQKIIVELYDKFFRTAFPKTVEKLGIVYTPVEIVDYINQSVAEVLLKEFGRSLSDENVHILDPFTGTGTFISRMIQSGLIDRKDLARKYEKELHANEIVLLAYYIASINIENTYHAVMGEETDYKSFNGICLTDTFQLGETNDTNWLYTPKLPKNSKRVQEQINTPIQVIVGNPPYSVGQKSANDNAQNQTYPKLEDRIAKTYAACTKANLKNSLYDSYIKAFRLASDRLDKRGGIIAFVSNGGWLDGLAMDGFRKCLEQEFSSIYVFNLRGNQRTKGEISRREGGKIFGSGSRTPITITLLVKKPGQQGKATIFYHDIGDYLSREEKLQIISKKKSVNNENMNWITLSPNEHGDWINQRNDVFTSFIPLGDKDDTSNSKTVFLPFYTNGLKTNRDAWCYNFSRNGLIKNVQSSILFYNSEVDRYFGSDDAKNIDIDSFINLDSKKISWDMKQKKDIIKGKKYNFSEKNIYISSYRPFQKEFCYMTKEFNNSVYHWPKLIQKDNENLFICVPSKGSNKAFSPLITNVIRDLDTYGGVQCYPLYYYEKKNISQPTLFDATSDSEYTRKDTITDFILEEVRQLYGPKVTKQDIFYYVYGILHSKDYRFAFASDLKKMLPRLPLVDKPADFWAFSKAGRELADLHLNYESQSPCAAVEIRGAESADFKVEKMRFGKLGGKHADKSVIEYNSSITLVNIPLAAYEYEVNGRSAIEWIMERYQVKIDTASGIKNDPNDWASELNKPRYILDLLLSIITVSLETMKIVNELPKLSFE